MSHQLKPGDRVRITIDAEVCDEGAGGLYYNYPAHYGTDHGFLRLDSPAVTVEHLPADPPPMERKPAPTTDADIDALGFGARVYNCLRRWEIHTVAALLNYTADELMDIRNFGPTALAEVRDVLAAHGLELRS